MAKHTGSMIKVGGIAVFGTAAFLAGRMTVHDATLERSLQAEDRTSNRMADQNQFGGRPPLGKPSLAESRPVVEALSSKDPLGRMSSLVAALDQLDPDGIATLSDFFMNDPVSDELDAELEMFVRAWAAVDGQGAMKFLQDLPPHRAQWPATAGALQAWARNDGEAAVAWANENNKSAQNWFLAAALQGFADADPSAAIAIVEDMPSGRARERAAEGIVNVLWEGGGEHAARVVDSLAGDVRIMAARALASHWVSEDLKSAVRWMEALDGEPVRIAVATRIAGQWGQQEPHAAAGWIAAIEDEKVRERAMEALVGSWTRRDSREASQWLSSFQLTEEMDAPVASFARLISREDPEGAIHWANAITDGLLRAKVVSEIAQTWKRRDAPSANAFLDAHPEFKHP